MSQRTQTVLGRILAETREELERRKREHPLDDDSLSCARRLAGARRFRDALAGPEIGVIAEFKRRSPSAGALHERPDLTEIVAAYARGGAVAVSILTEGPNFEGALEDLRAAREVCELPLLRKDFIVDTYQLHEALIAGADAVLPRCTARRAHWGWTCSSRSTTAGSCTARWSSGRTSSV
jgi:indole-3-glycerol phosphate synthase